MYNGYINYKGEPMTTVYTKPNCVQCDMTKRLMDKIGVEYTTVDIVENPAELDRLIEMGYRAAPVVVVTSETGIESWAGFQPEKITALAA
jgi:glutaredoxin-like protein NrdH